MLNRKSFTGILTASAIAVTALPTSTIFAPASAALLAPAQTVTTPSAAPLADLIEVKSKKKKRKKKLRKAKRRHKRYIRRNNDAGAFIAGAILGAIIANQGPYYVYRRGYPNVHISYCYNRFRSYRAWDNSFQPYYGPRRACRSPYWP